MTDQLTVPLDLAPAPYVLANTSFLTTLSQVEEQVDKLNIHDAESNQLAASLLVRLTTAGVQLEKTRKELTAPFRAAADKIMEVSRGPRDRIENAKSALKARQSAVRIFHETKMKPTWRCSELSRILACPGSLKT